MKQETLIKAIKDLNWKLDKDMICAELPSSGSYIYIARKNNNKIYGNCEVFFRLGNGDNLRELTDDLFSITSIETINNVIAIFDRLTSEKTRDKRAKERKLFEQLIFH